MDLYILISTSLNDLIYRKTHTSTSLSIKSKVTNFYASPVRFTTGQATGWVLVNPVRYTTGQATMFSPEPSGCSASNPNTSYYGLFLVFKNSIKASNSSFDSLELGCEFELTIIS